MRKKSLVFDYWHQQKHAVQTVRSGNVCMINGGI